MVQLGAVVVGSNDTAYISLQSAVTEVEKKSRVWTHKRHPIISPEQVIFGVSLR